MSRIASPAFPADQVSRGFILCALGLLTGFGPYVTDLYLPVLPAQAVFFGTTASMVQLGLTTSMAGLAAGQLLIGPLSDHYGRRLPLLLTLPLFSLVTLIAIFSPTIKAFVALRFVQGMMGAAGIVLARSIATDLYSGKPLVSAMSTISAVHGVAPVTAPVVGALLATVTDWRGIFGVLVALGLLLLLMARRLPESLPPERRDSGRIWRAFMKLGSVLGDPVFLVLVLQQCFACGVLFGYIASSPFIFQEIHGLSPLAFSACFAVNALLIGVGAAVGGKMPDPLRTLLVGAVLMVAASIAAGAALVFGAPIWVLEPAFIAMLFFFGFTTPTANAIAMDLERERSGAASAVLGASGFISGGIVSPLVGMGNLAYSTASTLFVSALLGLVASAAAVMWLRRHPARDRRGEPIA